MTIRVYDEFTRSTDSNLDAHTPTPTGDGWTEEARTGNQRQRILATEDWSEPSGPENSDRHIYTAQPNPTGAEYDVEAQLVNVPGGSGTDDPWFLVARLTDGSNFYSAGVYDNGPSADKKIFKTVGGTPTELASGSMSAEIAANDILMFEVRDATKKLYKNAGEELSTTNDDITASGRAGFGQGNAWVSTDDITHTYGTDNFELDEVAAPSSEEITPGAGAMAAAGEAAVARVNTFLTPDAGSLVMVGYQPTVDVTLPITPDAGSLVVAGAEPSIELEVFITPDAGSLVVAGYQPTVTEAGAVDTPLTPDAGSLVIAGAQPTVNVIRWITPDVGSLVVAGAQPTVNVIRWITPDVGSLVVAGYQPTINIIRWITPDAGSLVAVGYQPAVQQALNEVTPATGSLVAVGVAPDIRIEPPYHAVFNQKYGGAKAVTYGNKAKTVIYGNKAKDIKQ